MTKEEFCKEYNYSLSTLKTSFGRIQNSMKNKGYIVKRTGSWPSPDYQVTFDETLIPEKKIILSTRLVGQRFGHLTVIGLDKNKSKSKTNATSKTLNKESYLDNGNASLDLTEGNLTGVNGSDGNGITESDMSGENEQLTELISKGNIGVTSSAELLKQWRQVLINIDEMIIEECRDLFMLIY